MDMLFTDQAKIKSFVQIQESLSDLGANSENEKIEQVINQIPKSYFDNKDDLMVICSIIAYNSRNTFKNRQGNTIKLFEKIMEPIKTHLQDESSFFWNIFGNIYYLKLWMYEEGLISIDTIIQGAIVDNTLSAANYYMPEIFEKEPEIFEKEFKSKLKTPFSIEYVNEFKELRKKHFKWIKESNDYCDPIYREIEKNQLRLSIKCDDINSFQSILSNSNISVNSMIQESVLENVYLNPHEVSLIDYAIDFNSMKIFKYLYMNGAKSTTQSIFNSISNRNYEMIHLIESMNEENFAQNCLCFSVICCNLEMAKYAIENYDYDFLENGDYEPKRKELIIDIFFNICYSSNFQFFDSIFLPFLQKNPTFLKENIHDMIMNSMKDYSCYFMNELLKFPNININYYSKIVDDDDIDDDSFLIKAICKKNDRAVEILLNDPNIDIEDQKDDNCLPFLKACALFSDLKVLELFAKNPKFDINKKDEISSLTGFSLAALRGNFYALDFINKKFPDFIEVNAIRILFMSFDRNNEMVFKLTLQKLLMQSKNLTEEQLLDEMIKELFPLNNVNEEFIDKVKRTILELKSSS